MVSIMRPRVNVAITIAIAGTLGGCGQQPATTQDAAKPAVRHDVAARPQQSTPVLAEDAIPLSERTEHDRALLMRGSWLAVEATANGEHYSGGVGEVTTFTKDHVETVGHDFESNFEYHIDATRTPKYLNFGSGGSGIYALEGDTLRWRTSSDEQPLDFDTSPQGLWNEQVLKRIDEAEAKARSSALHDERLGIKASTP